MFACRQIVAASLVLFPVFFAASATATDFRVDNTVTVEGEQQPQSKGATIFHGGMVYDFIADPAEVIIFDKPHGQFVLLDLGRHVQSEVSTDEVKEFIDLAKKRLIESRNAPQVRWLAEPKFIETFDSQTLQLNLRSEWMTYHAHVLPTGPDVATLYRDFSDSYAQFNHVLNPQSRPPFPRMMLNAALERNHGIAKEVRLTSNFSRSPSPVTVVSRHELAAQLDSSDMKRIDEAREAMKSFEHVSLQEYVKKK